MPLASKHWKVAAVQSSEIVLTDATGCEKLYLKNGSFTIGHLCRFFSVASHLDEYFCVGDWFIVDERSDKFHLDFHDEFEETNTEQLAIIFDVSSRYAVGIIGGTTLVRITGQVFKTSELIKAGRDLRFLLQKGHRVKVAVKSLHPPLQMDRYEIRYEAVSCSVCPQKEACLIGARKIKGGHAHGSDPVISQTAMQRFVGRSFTADEVNHSQKDDSAIATSTCSSVVSAPSRMSRPIQGVGIVGMLDSAGETGYVWSPQYNTRIYFRNQECMLGEKTFNCLKSGQFVHFNAYEPDRKTCGCSLRASHLRAYSGTDLPFDPLNCGIIKTSGVVVSVSQLSVVVDTAVGPAFVTRSECPIYNYDLSLLFHVGEQLDMLVTEDTSSEVKKLSKEYRAFVLTDIQKAVEVGNGVHPETQNVETIFDFLDSPSDLDLKLAFSAGTENQKCTAELTNATKSYSPKSVQSGPDWTDRPLFDNRLKSDMTPKANSVASSGKRLLKAHRVLASSQPCLQETAKKFHASSASLAPISGTCVLTFGDLRTDGGINGSHSSIPGIPKVKPNPKPPKRMPKAQSRAVNETLGRVPSIRDLSVQHRGGLVMSIGRGRAKLPAHLAAIANRGLKPLKPGPKPSEDLGHSKELLQNVMNQSLEVVQRRMSVSDSMVCPAPLSDRPFSESGCSAEVSGTPEEMQEKIVTPRQENEGFKESNEGDTGVFSAQDGSSSLPSLMAKNAPHLEKSLANLETKCVDRGCQTTETCEREVLLEMIGDPEILSLCTRKFPEKFSRLLALRR